ncbi:MAG TPA: NADH-quinone oxidoreductase subunit NuoG [Xanthomonadaceae bacterium]|nr:NADH-quinone oxidoreductase subunit NuoG [Xanthomonadaceae bacterium]
MSAQPTNNTAPDLVNIEIDGQAMQVPKGAMIIQAADKAGIPIPRFCYHEKLSIAANCRMCLVDVEKAPKPMPACATPVMDGMRVYTQSRRALDAQRGVMEFLLINHPLDCPICDQGGECELQDLSLGYGRSVSRFVERKRVVPDEDLGSLVATEMTRCIQCTRCVRFLDEIAGTHEFGGMNRGEHLEIGTYIGKSLESELQGNIIDICPVGALTNKPFRFRARAWELIARESIGYHDALGSNLYLHTRRGEVLRCVPRENEQINETWLSDRDRWSHTGLHVGDRLATPMLRQDGRLREVSWDDALAATAAALREAGIEIGALVSPSASCEEMYLLQGLLRGLGSNSIDHRLRQLDFSDQDAWPAEPRFERALAEVEYSDAILVIGGHPRLDQPLLGHRIRKAWRNGARIFALNALSQPTHYEHAAEIVALPSRLPGLLAGVLELAGGPVPAAVRPDMDQAARRVAEGLKAGTAATILFGDLAAQHPQAALLRHLARALASATGAAYNEIPAGANAAGAWRYGAVPHRGPGGAPMGNTGRHAADMLDNPPHALVLYGAEAPEDFAHGGLALRALEAAPHVVAFSAFLGDALRQHADIVLPIGLLPEIDATLVNLDGRTQSVAAGAKAPGHARAGWRVLRALGGELGVPGFDFLDLAGLRGLMAQALDGVSARPAEFVPQAAAAPAGEGLERIATVPTYAVDAVVRRSAALQATPLGVRAEVVLHPEDALALGLGQDGVARVSDGDAAVELPFRVHGAVPRGAVWIPAACVDAAPIGAAARVLVEKIDGSAG